MNTELMIKISISVGLMMAYGIVVGVKGRIVRRYAQAQRIGQKQTALTNKLITILLFVGLVVAETVTWGVHLQGVVVFVSSFFAMVAIGFFAVWSVLSNITSSVLIFFLFPFNIGDHIEVVGDDIKGVIKDLTLFHMILEGDDDKVVTIPNNVVIQKSIRILPRDATASARA